MSDPKPEGIEVIITRRLVVSCTGSAKGNGRAFWNEEIAELIRIERRLERELIAERLEQRAERFRGYEISQLLRSGRE